MKNYNSLLFEDKFYEYKGYTVFPRLNLEEFYEPIGDSKMVVERNAQNCIYCGNNFEKEKTNYAHLIPELFGKNKSHNRYECSSCNELSGKWETSLGAFTMPLRVMGKVKNKKGRIPKFKSRQDGLNKPTIIQYLKNGNLNIELATMEDFDLFDGKLKFRVGGHNPFHVYKAFLKVALSLMPNQVLKEEKWMVDLLFHKVMDERVFPAMYLMFLNTKIVKEPYFRLLRYKGVYPNHPKYILLVGFGKSIVQIILPMYDVRKKIVVHLPRFMEILGVRETYNVEKIDLENNINESRDWIFDIDIKNSKSIINGKVC